MNLIKTFFFNSDVAFMVNYQNVKSHSVLLTTFISTIRRCRSIQYPQRIRIHCASPIHARAVTFGGGEPNTFPRYMIISNTTKIQNAQTPVLSVASVVRRYNPTPMPKIRSSTTRVPQRDNHRPKPTRYELPGYSGRSGRWTTASSTQWLTTANPRTNVPRG